MGTSETGAVVRRIRAAMDDGAGPTDAQLLGDYVGRPDGAALEALVRRHGPMVWGVCRRVLRNHHDAEDAFQATFLVLVRRATSITSRELLANWLHGVAYQTARKARATAAKRNTRERQVAEMPEPVPAEQAPWDDLQPLLDEELGRLPAHYRGVIILCDLEGMTRREAAGQLAIPEGSVASRLARARAMLAKRLTQRGVVFSSGSVAAVLSAGSASASAHPDLVASTIKAANLLATGQAAGVVSAKIADLTEGVVNAMFTTKIKSVLAVVLVVGVALAGAAGLIYQTQAADQPKAKMEQPASKKDEKKGEEKQAMTKEEELKVLIDKVLAAHGGEDKLNKLQFTMTVKVDNGTTDRFFVQPPKHFRWESQHRDSTTKQIVILFPDGRRWWTKKPNEDAQEFIPLGAELAMEYHLDRVKFFGPRQVLRLKDADHRVALLDEEVKVEGRATVGVELTNVVLAKKVTANWKLRMYFDKETHLPVKLVGVLGVAQEDTYYRDYKKFDSIPVAQKEKHPHAGAGAWQAEVTDFKVVEKFDAKLFERP